MEEFDFESYEDRPEEEEGLEEEQVFVSKVMRGLRLAGVEAEKIPKKREDLDELGEDEKREIGRSGFVSKDYSEVAYHNLGGTEKNSKKVEVKIYAPKAFLDVRRICKVSPKDFVEGWDFHKKEIPQPKLGAGRSGSLFITSKNKKFIFKTIPHFEVETLVEILPHLHKHYLDNPDSRITRFLGLYRFTGHGNEMHVIIMTNMLYHPGWPIHTKYDLKGRKPKPGKAQRDVEEKEKKGAVLKDNDDLSRKFFIDDPAREALLKTLTNDVNFLLAHNCMDYSLLVGVHSKKRMLEESEAAEKEKTKGSKKGKKKGRQERSATTAVKPKDDKVSDEEKAASDGEKAAKKKKKGKKSKKEKEEKRAKKAKKAAEFHEDTLPPISSSEEHQEIYFIGIIDPLSRYGTKKKVAHLLKITLWDADTLSTIPAAPYATRYLNYLHEIFPPKEDPKEEEKEKKKKKKKKAAEENHEEAKSSSEEEKKENGKKEKGSKREKGDKKAKKEEKKEESDEEANDKKAKSDKKEKGSKREGKKDKGKETGDEDKEDSGDKKKKDKKKKHKKVESS